MIEDRAARSPVQEQIPTANEHAVDVRQGDGVRCEFHRYGTGPAGSHPRHAHETYQIGYSPDFDGGYWYRGEHVRVPQGHLHVLHPGKVHAARSSPPAPGRPVSCRVRRPIAHPAGRP